MPTPLRALIVEDSEDDALHILRLLKRADYDVVHARVDSAQALYSALTERTWDIVLSDHSMPGFSGLAALEIVRQFSNDLPFIFVSGTIGEEAAVTAMRNGAADYVLKGNLKRLAPAVERELRDAVMRFEHKRAEQALLASEERYRHLFQGSPLPLWVYDLETLRFLDVNEAACGKYGYGRDEFLGMTIRDIRPDDELPRLDEQLRTLDQQPVRTSTWRHRLKDGTLIDVEITSHEIELKGRRARFVCPVDVTARQKTEIALRKAEENYRSIFENVVEGIYIVDAEGRVISANPALARMLGYESSEEMAAGISHVAHQVYVDPAARRRYRDLVQKNKVVSNFETTWRRKDGSTIGVSLSARLVAEEATGNVYQLGIAHDISERMQLREALREREAALRRAQEMAGLSHVVTRPDGTFDSWSENLPALIGVDQSSMPRSTREWLDLLHPEDRERLRSQSIAAAKTGLRTEVAYRLHRADGEWIHVAQIIEPLEKRGESGSGTHWFSTILDVTKQWLGEQKIRRLNRVYAVLSGINTLIVRVRNRDELFREACRIAAELGEFRLAWIGVPNPESHSIVVVAAAGDDLGHLAMDRPMIRPGEATPRGLAARAVESKHYVVCNDIASDKEVLAYPEQALARGYRSAIALPLIVDSQVVGVLHMYSAEKNVFDSQETMLLAELAGDISFAMEHIGKSEKLEYLAYYDELTGLANHTLFRERVGQIASAAVREGKKFATVMLDIERFKTINDTLGRTAGDDLLRQIAERARCAVVDSNWLARIGADHFAAVFPEMKEADDVARYLTVKYNEMFDAPFVLGDTELRISARLGIAMFPNDGTDADALLRNAEEALKNAKRSGDRYVFYAEQMTARVAWKLSLENKLRRALENDEFELHYQPKVRLEDRGLSGVEALIRWNDPASGLVPPAEFIPLLEETGLILEVGAWALRRAVADYRQWVASGLRAPRIAVNVSPRQLRQEDFVQTVWEAVAKEGSPPGIDLEITESLIMEDVEGNISKLRALGEMGISIAIDDFGTGYSSLGYLARLPIQTLKIDRSFVITMLQDPNTMALVSTIISLAHSLQLKVVAEGVDSEDQARMLHLLRCEEMQGFLFSAPLPAEELIQLLRTGA